MEACSNKTHSKNSCKKKKEKEEWGFSRSEMEMVTNDKNKGTKEKKIGRRGRNNTDGWSGKNSGGVESSNGGSGGGGWSSEKKKKKKGRKREKSGKERGN
jgi:hypothetical protein